MLRPLFVREPCKHIVEIFFRINSIGYTGLQNTVCGCARPSAFGRVAEQPILSAYRKGADAVFRRVIVYLTDSVCQVTFEILFIAYGIEQGSSNTGLGQNCGETFLAHAKNSSTCFFSFP